MAKRKRLAVPDPSKIAAPETKAMDIPIGYAPDHMKRRAPIADVAGQAATTAALETVAGEMQAAREEGRLVQKIPLDAVDAAHMIRDRITIDPEEMATLEASLLARGQQTPIEVVETTPGRYGLISGWRRISALGSLAQRGEGPGNVLALIRKPDTASDAYIAMVEENEIRVGLSYFERASIVAGSVREGVFRNEKEALNSLFAAASRAKRSKIKSFLPVVETLGAYIRHPSALTERLGLAVSTRLQAEPDWGKRLYDRLRKADPATPEDEAALIQKALEGGSYSKKVGQGAAKPAPTIPASPITVSRSKGTLRLSGPAVTDDLMDAIEALVRDWKA
ncbi:MULTISPECIES: ParB/RepB/Spo0J family partition protein [unclassified Sulfitobacter]|uniref:ParB/RepB/Spo0J family partition protein n=1 Tax=unclassified Sulfitobacter TaxID=196795 RepID=UPI0037469D68